MSSTASTAYGGDGVKVFICISSLHVLNAIEARYHWRLNPESCVLLLLPRVDDHRDALEEIVGLVPWGEVVYIENDPKFDFEVSLGEQLSSAKRLYLAIRKWRKILRPWKRCSLLCMPCLNNSMMKRLHAWLRPDTLMLTDDGTLTGRMLYKKRSYFEYDPIEDYVYEDLQEGVKSRSKEKFFTTPFGVVHLLSDLVRRPPYSQRYVLFSQYSHMSPLGFSGVKNNYEWLQSRAEQGGGVTRTVHFLGAPLVERDGIPSEEYLTWLRKVRECYSDYEFVYFLHPVESDEFGEGVRKSLSCSVQRSLLPYELLFAISKQRPSVVASWFCSALEYVAKYHDLRVEAYRFDVGGYATTPALSSAKVFYGRHSRNKSSTIDVISL